LNYDHDSSKHNQIDNRDNPFPSRVHTSQSGTVFSRYYSQNPLFSPSEFRYPFPGASIAILLEVFPDAERIPKDYGVND